jgi:hypothetical protein
MELRHFDYRAQARPKFANRFVKDSGAFALRDRLLGIRGMVRDLEMQSWVTGQVEAGWYRRSRGSSVSEGSVLVAEFSHFYH